MKKALLEHLRRHWVLYALTFAGAALRLWGIGFAANIPKARPDEELFIQQALFMFSSDKNPHWAAMGWPELYFYVNYAVLEIAHFVTQLGHGDVSFGCLYVISPGRLTIPIRLAAAGFGIATIPMTAALARACVPAHLEARWGKPIALFAAAAMAFNILHARDSHFAVSDPALVLMVTCALWQLARSAKDPRRAGRHLIAAGVFIGLGASIKYTGLSMLGILFVAWLMRFLHEPSVPGRRRLIGVGVAAVGAAVLAFVVTSPHVITTPQRFVEGLHAISDRYEAAGASWGYEAGREPVKGGIYHGTVTLPHAFGWPLYLLSLFGMAAAFWRTRGGAFVCLMHCVIFYGAVLGPSTILFMRYAMPLYPAMAALAGFGLLTIFERLPKKRRRLGDALLVIAAALFFVLPIARIVDSDRVMARADTREQARAWLVAHLNEGDHVVSQGDFVAMPTVDDNAVRACRPVVPDSLWQRPIPHGAHGPFYDRLVEQGDQSYGNIARRYLIDVAGRGDTRRARYIVQAQPQLPCGRYAAVRDVRPLPACYARVAEFSPGTSSCETVYDTFDMYMQPVAERHEVERPGPRVQIFENRCPGRR